MALGGGVDSGLKADNTDCLPATAAAASPSLRLACPTLPCLAWLPQLPGLERGLLLQLLPKDANDARGVVVEVRLLCVLCLLPAVRAVVGGTSVGCVPWVVVPLGWQSRHLRELAG